MYIIKNVYICSVKIFDKVIIFFQITITKKFMESISLKDVLTLCKKRSYQNCVICTPDQKTIVRDGIEIRNFKILNNNMILMQDKYRKIYTLAPEDGYYVFINKIIIADRIVKRIKNSKTLLDEEEYFNILTEVLNYEFHVFPEKDIEEYLLKLFICESEQTKIRKVIWNRK